MTPRICRACTATLTRKPNERDSNWARRTVCGEQCRMTLLRGLVRKLDSTKVPGKCKRCGKTVLRSARFKTSVACTACVSVFRQENATRSREAKRLEAQRYRVLMTVLGWDDFGELIDYLRTVPWVTMDGRRIRGLRESA